MSGFINVGLDFGSLNYRAAYIANNKVIPVPADDALIWSGNLQLSQVGTDFRFTSLKYQIGNGQTAPFGGEKKSVEDIILYSFKGIKRKIEEFTGEVVGSLTLAVPTRYSSFRRAELLAIATRAGFEHVSFINDAMAATLAYTFGQDIVSTFLVYSMGYSGYEISLVRAAKQNLRELAHDGSNTPAGEDFDASLIHLCLGLLRQQMYPQHAHTSPLYVSKEQILDLSNLVTDIKHSLSVGDVVRCVLSAKNQDTPIVFSFTRSQFENLIASHIQTTFEAVDHLLEEARMQYTDVDQVLLVGGSTHIDAVRHQLEARFGSKLVSLQDDILARGAALQATKMLDEGAALLSAPDDSLKPSLDDSAPPILITMPPIDREMLPSSADSAFNVAGPAWQRSPNPPEAGSALPASSGDQTLNLAIDTIFDYLLALARSGGEQQVDDLLTLVSARMMETTKALEEARRTP